MVEKSDIHIYSPQSSYQGIPNHIVFDIAVGSTLSMSTHTRESPGSPRSQRNPIARFLCRAWEIRRESWRCLRHDRALGYFRADLTAPNFTNPPERVALFREFKEGQALRHARRVHLLRDLCSRRPGVENNEVRQSTRKTRRVSSAYE